MFVRKFINLQAIYSIEIRIGEVIKEYLIVFTDDQVNSVSRRNPPADYDTTRAFTGSMDLCGVVLCALIIL